jgi:adhesin HecA-like repeat protein
MVDASALATAPDIRHQTRAGERQWWTFWMKRKTETLVSYDFGQLSHPDQPASLTASGAITIRTAGGLLNSGGEINANGGDLNISALHVETVGLGDGKVHLRRVCVLVCSYDAAGTVRYLGGQLNAAGDIRIEAQDHVVNRAGTIRAIGHLGISAAQVDLHAGRVPLLVMRPSGFYNFWSSKGALLFLRDQFGGLIAETGGIDIRSPRPLRSWGGSLTAGQEIALESGQEIVRAPDFRAAGSDQTIGLLANLPLLGR